MKKFVNVNDFISWVQVQKRFSKKESLDKMKYFCSILGNPEAKFKSIHITGTNGKGSTVAMLNSILTSRGLNVATFTSPYITYFNERIGYKNTPISNDDLLKYANTILDKYEQITNDGYELPTFFEFVTLVAFLYFANLDDLDIAIIEVGMGGRLDSTNVIIPILSVITNVAYDHMQVLGNTLEDILKEKLGIVKNNIPVVCGIKNEKLQEICKVVANNHNSTLKFPTYESLKIYKCDTSLSNFSYNGYNELNLSLIGYHQIDNAMVVIEAYKLIKDELLLTDENLRIGLSTVRWQGRLEVVSSNPYILVDGGHNIDGVTRVCEFVSNLEYKYKRAVVSISHDKEVEKMIELIDNTFDEVIFTKYTYARSADANVLYDLSNAKIKKLIPNIKLSIEEVYNSNADITIFMGSLYLVSEVRNLIGKKNDWKRKKRFTINLWC